MICDESHCYCDNPHECKWPSFWRWTFVWCGVCNTEVVVLGRRWIRHNDLRPECNLCRIQRIVKELGIELVS